MPTLAMSTPLDFDLARDVCSYGYFVLAPNRWDLASHTFQRVLALRQGLRPAPVVVTMRQRKPGSLHLSLSRPLSDDERREARAQIARMLRLDESSSRIAQFHAVDPRWKQRGRGRLFRSPTLFEDVVKTVTSCNVQWPGTVQMNRRLCEVVGSSVTLPAAKPITLHAFPTPAQLARTRPSTLRSRCRVGYRDERLVQLAQLFTLAPSKGGIDQRWLEDPATPDDAMFKYLITLPGVGPYAAANIMQLLGRYRRLPLDTEAARHGREVLGFTGTQTAVMRKVRDHFHRFGDDAFRSYWFEMWTHAEARKGPAETWLK
jgi:3-methyladenine DNA glycosylase/8-oxoguanine DNA glycosylase